MDLRMEIARITGVPPNDSDSNLSDDSSSTISTLTPSDRSQSPKNDIKREIATKSEDVNDKKMDKHNSDLQFDNGNGRTEKRKTEKHGTNTDSDNTGNTDDADILNNSFEVEAIIAHKKVKGVDKWRIRWVGYGPEDDTWEPRENLYGDNVLTMLEEFEARRKQREERRDEKRKSKNADKSKKRSIKEEKSENEKDEESDADLDDSNIEGWYGIKKDEGTLEQRRLFVADRRLSKTEKLLNEINASPGVRVLRNQIKDQLDRRESTASVEPPRRSKKAKRQLISGGDLFTPELSPVKIVADEQKKSIASKKTLKRKKDADKEEDDAGKKIKKIKINETESPKGEQIQFIEPPKDESNKEKSPEPAAISKPESGKEFGISKNLKAAYIAKHASSKKDTQKRSDKHSESSTSILKPKAKEEKKQSKPKIPRSISPEGPLKIFPEGTNISAEVDKISKKMEVNKKHNVQQISQEEFEEIVLDAKIERVRDVLMLNSQKPFLNLNHVDDLGQTLIHKLCEIRCGVSHTQCELIYLLASNGARLDIRESSNGQIPLHIAIANRRLCHVRKLLALRSPVNLPDRNNKSPIMLALECSSDTDFLKFLLKAGASFQHAYEKICKDRDQRYKKQMRIITEHETRLRRALNSARDNVTMNMTVKCISPIFVNPLHEGELNHTFYLSTQPQLPGTDNAYVLFFGIAEFSVDEQDKDACCTIVARMWGRSPVLKTTMNGKECTPLRQGNHFAFLCVPCRDQNQLTIKLDPEMQQSGLVLLSQMVLLQFHVQQSSRNVTSTHALTNSQHHYNSTTRK